MKTTENDNAIIINENNSNSLSLEYIQQTLRDIRLKTTQINNFSPPCLQRRVVLKAVRIP